ncbi:MAG TPA: ribbon-helix-helix protein, CopG family [Longimicrobiaceae bacterium]|nr:ribbon-helix-helix protein, CopG family [Longimicrobiaceae bacterium]
MTTLQIRLSDEMVREIERMAGEAGQERDEFIADALRRHIAEARGVYRARMDARSFEMVRERLRPYAEEAGFTREEDILADDT